jgi:hypothetical protein
MKAQFYISDSFCDNFMPFFLYRNCLKNLLEKKNYIFELIYDLTFIEHNVNNIFISNIYSIDINKLQSIKNMENKIILINTEYYNNCNVIDILNEINRNNLNIYIFEYNILNIEYYTKNLFNLKYYFIPLVYNVFLENYYNLNITKVDYVNKDIDILFIGGINDRRNNILNELKIKYNVHIISGYTGYEENKNICRFIERSKIVINILYYHYNLIFDYYRNSFLLSNKVLLINEKNINFNYEIEKDLKDLDNILIMTEYDNLVNMTDKYMNINQDEYLNIVNNQYYNFKKYDMEKYFNSFIL